MTSVPYRVTILKEEMAQSSVAPDSISIDLQNARRKKEEAKHATALSLAASMAAVVGVVDLESDTIDISAFPQLLDQELTDHLVRVLSANESITALDLSNNTITSDMADRIGHLMTVNPSIRSLTMVNCKLSDSSASTIFRCCRKFKSVRCLNFSKNPQLGNIALGELEKVIHGSSVISEIHLMDTGVSFEGAVQVVEAMVSNTSLTFVALPFVVGHLLLAEVEKILERNWRLLQNADRAVNTVQVLQQLADKEEELMRTKWKAPPAPDVGCSHRVKTVMATREEWTNPTSKVHLMYLTLLDRKATLDATQKGERDHMKKMIASQPTGGISGRSPRSSPRSNRGTTAGSTTSRSPRSSVRT